VKLIEEPKDLVVLVADGDMKATVDALLNRRHDAIGIRRISSEVIKDDDHDPGVFRRCHELLRAQRRQFQHAIAICDRDGSGKEPLSRAELEKKMEETKKRSRNMNAPGTGSAQQLPNWETTTNRNTRHPAPTAVR